MDDQGNAYLGGDVFFNEHLITSGSEISAYSVTNNAFATKYDKSGQKEWTTYFGGSSNEWQRGLSVTSSGGIAMAGYTYSKNTSQYASSDGYLAAFSEEGILEWMQFWDGAYNDQLLGVATDRQGCVVVCGQTGSETVDAFLAKYSPEGNLLWTNKLEGRGTDKLTAVDTDPEGNIIVGGVSNREENNGCEDILVAKFDPRGQCLWRKYFGGSAQDNCSGIAVDEFSNIFLTGYTASPNGITSPKAHQSALSGEVDGFLMKLNPAGERLWGTYLGGRQMEYADSKSIALGADGQVHLTGSTKSRSGIATPHAFQRDYAGNLDAYLVTFTSEGQLIWGSYLGSDFMEMELNIAADQNGSICLAGVTSSPYLAGPGWQETVNNQTIRSFLMTFKQNPQQYLKFAFSSLNWEEKDE